MNFTPEELARAFHETYSRVAPLMYGHSADARAWDDVPEKSRAVMIAVCAEILGQPYEVKQEESSAEVIKAEPIGNEWKRSKATEAQEPIGDWLKAMDDEIASITAKDIRGAQANFDGIVRD